jgi:hypothetical protein
MGVAPTPLAFAVALAAVPAPPPPLAETAPAVAPPLIDAALLPATVVLVVAVVAVTPADAVRDIELVPAALLVASGVSADVAAPGEPPHAPHNKSVRPTHVLDRNIMGALRVVDCPVVAICVRLGDYWRRPHVHSDWPHVTSIRRASTHSLSFRVFQLAALKQNGTTAAWAAFF